MGFMTGKNYWEIRVDRSPTAYLFIGVATGDTNLSTFLGGDEYGWGYIGDRALYHKRNKIKLYGDRFGQGDVIGITLDMDEGTLSFAKNGVDLGVAIQNLSGVLYPAVAFYNRGQRVTILTQPGNGQLPGAGVACACSSPQALCRDGCRMGQSTTSLSCLSRWLSLCARIAALLLAA